MSDATAPRPSPATPSGDDLTLMVNGAKFTGWQDVHISRGIEEFPSYFLLSLTEKNPGSSTSVFVVPGDRCQVLIGTDVIITGYIDTYKSRASTDGLRVTVAGRSSTEDLVDCAAGVQDGQENSATMTFSAPSLLQLAKDLCAPFGITVIEPDGEGQPLVSLGDGIPQFTIPLGQTVYQTLEPYARWLQMLMLDGTDGSLILAKVATEKPPATRAFALPGNCEEAEVGFRVQQRFSIYLPAQSTFDGSFDQSSALHMSSVNFQAPVKDEAAFAGRPRWDGKARYRPTFVVSEQAISGIYLSEQRAKWQKARDFGRSQAVTVMVSTWRDGAGKLWAPNTLAGVDIPKLKLPKLTWIIADVEFLRGGKGRGTRALVTLMPPEAFSPEPSFLATFDPQIAQALDQAVRASRSDPSSPNYNRNLNAPTGGI